MLEGQDTRLETDEHAVELGDDEGLVFHLAPPAGAGGGRHRCRDRPLVLGDVQS